MKRKAVGFIFALLMLAVFLYGCGGGGGSHSNPAAPSNTGLARVSGKIVDSAQKPVADVKVRLALTTNSLVNSLPSEIKNTLRLSTTDNSTEFNTTTDKNGQYTFENVPYGRYSLFANSGDKGALITNLEVSESIRAVKNPTIMKPFGFVTGTVKDGENKAIYGARVYISDDVGNPITAVNGTKNGLTSFTNNEGAFTLSYIPIETQYSFTASLEGYGPKTDSFTISATETDLIHNCKPIVLEPTTTQVSSYTIPVDIAVDSGVEISKPVYVIAQNSYNHVFFNVIKGESEKACYLKIPESGEYELFAIDSNGLRADHQGTIKVTSTDISENVKHEPITIKFAGSSSEDEPEPKTVIIKKIEISPTVDGNPISDYISNTLNKYGDCVSCLDSNGELYYITLDGIDNKENWQLVTLNNNGPTSICGSSAVCLPPDFSYSIWYTKDGEENISFSLEEGEFAVINQLAFYPNDYISVAYDYDCAGSKFHYVKTYESQDATVGDVPFKRQDRDYSYSTSSGETIYPFALRMAKGNDGNCYLAALYSGHGLRIYNVSTSNKNEYVAFEDDNVGNDLWTITNFQVLNDSNRNILFYIENERSDNKVYAYLINQSTNSKDSDSSRKSCYIDKNGNMYRYDSSEATTTNTTGHKIIKISSSSPTLAGTATTTMDLAESSAPNENINGILGFEEDDKNNTLTIYAY